MHNITELLKALNTACLLHISLVHPEELSVLCTHDEARVSLHTKVQVAGEAYGPHHSPSVLCLHPHFSGVQLHSPVSTGET